MGLFFSLAAAAMGNIFYIHRHPFILKYFVDCGITVTADHLCYTGTAYIVGSALIGDPMLLATSQRSKRKSLECIHTFLLFLRFFYIEKKLLYKYNTDTFFLCGNYYTYFLGIIQINRFRFVSEHKPYFLFQYFKDHPSIPL